MARRGVFVSSPPRGDALLDGIEEQAGACTACSLYRWRLQAADVDRVIVSMEALRSSHPYCNRMDRIALEKLKDAWFEYRRWYTVTSSANAFCRTGIACLYGRLGTRLGIWMIIPRHSLSRHPTDRLNLAEHPEKSGTKTILPVTPAVSIRSCTLVICVSGSLAATIGLSLP